MRIPEDRSTIEVIPLRGAELHLNALKLLEEKVCTDCLKVGNFNIKDGVLNVDVTLKHPFPGALEYTAFDVRAILITGADYTFPESGRSISWTGEHIRLLNPDGYTPLFNPTEFPVTQPGPPALRYIPGHLAPGGDLSATLNPFTCFQTEETRRMFEAGASLTKTISLALPPGPLEFGYAVDACWTLVDGTINDPLTDFPPEANCQEAYRVSAGEMEDLCRWDWCTVPIRIDVYDHQPGTVSAVMIESPSVFDGFIPLAYKETNADGADVFEGEIPNTKGPDGGTYPILVRVVDKKADPNMGQIDAWQTVPLKVPKGWVQTWGGDGTDVGYAVAYDKSGGCVVGGLFGETVDFDPGPGVVEVTPVGDIDAFLSRFDSNGILQWVKTWGGTGQDDVGAVTVGESGTIYACGSFRDSVDLDPGPGIDQHVSNGVMDAYLCAFTSDGDYLWGHTWGGAKRDYATDLALGTGECVFVVGDYSESVDFDPSPATVQLTSHGFEDPYLLKYSSSGEFQWVRSWGGTGHDRACGTTMSSDDSVVCVVGGFYDIVDFDPGSGIDEHISAGSEDAYSSWFTTEGEFLKAACWGSSGIDESNNACALGSDGIAVIGSFSGTVDFDPGPGLDTREAGADPSTFVSRFTSSGDYQWVRSWDAWWNEIAASDTGSLYVAGSFYETVDFDPGPGCTLVTPSGYSDVCVTKLSKGGALEQVFTFGGTYDSMATINAIVLGLNGEIWVTGDFTGEVDFDPSEGQLMRSSNGFEDAFLWMSSSDKLW